MNDLFLIIIGLIYLIIASISDLKKREVLNWLCFSLIAFGLSYRAFLSVQLGDYRYFLSGLLGFAVFFVLAYVFYYGRIFAGGDAKLMMGIGAVLPFSLQIKENLLFILVFLFFLVLAGSIYGSLFSIFLAVRARGFGREFIRQAARNKKLFLYAGFLALVLLVILFLFKSYLELIFLIFPAILLAFPLLYIYARAIEEAAMIVEMRAEDATIGDWLYEDVKVRGKIIKPNWEGLSEKEVEMLKNYKGKIKIKQGIPFIPAFLFAFILYIFFRSYILAYLGIL